MIPVVTATEVTETPACARPTADNRVEKLVEEGDRTGKIGARAGGRVWTAEVKTPG